MNAPPTMYYVEREDGSIAQVLHLSGDGEPILVPVARGSDGEAFLRRVGIRVDLSRPAP